MPVRCGPNPASPDEEMAAAGLRALAFARKEMPPDATRARHGDLAEGLQFIGL